MESRTEASSSTTKTVRRSERMAVPDGIRRARRRRFERAAVRLGNGAADRQAQPHAGGFARHERLEQALAVGRGNARPVVSDHDAHVPVIVRLHENRDATARAAASDHRFDRIRDQVAQHDLDLQAVDEERPAATLGVRSRAKCRWRWIALSAMRRTATSKLVDADHFQAGGAARKKSRSLRTISAARSASARILPMMSRTCGGPLRPVRAASAPTVRSSSRR